MQDINYYWNLYYDDIKLLIGRTIKQQAIIQQDTEDMYSDAYFWLIKANEKYDKKYNIPHKNYCLNYLYLYFRQYYKILKHRRLSYTNMHTSKYQISYLESYTDQNDEEFDFLGEEARYKDTDLMDIIGTFKSDYQIVLKMYASGYIQKDIAEYTGIKQFNINQMCKTIRKMSGHQKKQSINLYNYLKC